MIDSEKIGEPLYFYLSNEWYKGRMPTFYDSSDWKLTAYLKDNYSQIKEEVLALYGSNKELIKSNFTPYNYHEKGWKTINLYTYGLRYSKNCALFPVLDSVVKKIPGMTMVQIAILEPGVRVKAHLGDTNAIVRNHLGISIPGTYPELGLRVGQNEVCWKEGEVFSFCIVHRHYAWNNTKGYRIAVIIDVIHPDYHNQIAKVCGESLALIGMKFIATKIPLLKHMPKPITRVVQKLISIPFRLKLWAQGAFKLENE